MVRLRHLTASLLTLSLLFVTVPAFAQDGKRLISEKDIFQFNWTANPQMSPDGKWLAFNSSTIAADFAKEKKPGEKTEPAKKDEPKSQEAKGEEQGSKDAKPVTPEPTKSETKAEEKPEHESDVKVISRAV